MSDYGLSAATGGLFGLIGQGISSAANAKENEKEYQRQKEFAQNSIRWKVNDAKLAGLHPLYALGGSGASYSPQATGGGDNLAAAMSQIGEGVGGGLANMTKASQEQRQIMTERNLLQNELLASQIEKTRQESASLAKMASTVNSDPASANKKLADKTAIGLDKAGKQNIYEAAATGVGKFGETTYSYIPNDKLSDAADANPVLKGKAILDGYSEKQALHAMKERANPKDLKDGNVFKLKPTKFGYTWSQVPRSEVSDGDWYMNSKGEVKKRANFWEKADSFVFGEKKDLDYSSNADFYGKKRKKPTGAWRYAPWNWFN